MVLQARINIFYKKDAKVKLAIKLEKNMASIYVFYNIIYEIRQKQELCPFILFLIDKCWKIDLYYTILLFILVIYLRIECSKKLLLDVKEVAW